MRERVSGKTRKSKPVILVVCEGETEREYIEILRRHFRLPITIKTKVPGGNINARLVDQYVNELGVGNKTECMVFFVYDADVAAVVAKLKSIDGTLLLSNPCIEFWFLLHLLDYRKTIGSIEVVKRLRDSHPDWRAYHKGCLSVAQERILIANMGLACNRGCKLQSNPSSDLYRFIATLENLKKR